MIAQFLRGYRGAFNFTEMMSMDSRLFFTYYKNLTRVYTFEAGEFIDGLHKDKPDSPTPQAISKIKQWEQQQ